MWISFSFLSDSDTLPRVTFWFKCPLHPTQLRTCCTGLYPVCVPSWLSWSLTFSPVWTLLPYSAQAPLSCATHSLLLSLSSSSDTLHWILPLPGVDNLTLIRLSHPTPWQHRYLPSPRQTSGLFGLSNCRVVLEGKGRSSGKRKRNLLSTFGQLLHLWEIESCLSKTEPEIQLPLPASPEAQARIRDSAN